MWLSTLGLLNCHIHFFLTKPSFIQMLAAMCSDMLCSLGKLGGSGNQGIRSCSPVVDLGEADDLVLLSAFRGEICCGLLGRILPY